MRGATKLAGVVLALGALVACGSGDEPAAVDAEGFLRDALEASVQAGSYHLAATIVAGDLEVRYDADVDLPGRVRAATRIGDERVRSVTVGGDTWIRDPRTGRWRNRRTAEGGAPAPDPFAPLRAMEDLRLTGAEDVGGTTADRIEGSAPAGTLLRVLPAAGVEAAGTATVTVWIARGTSRILRVGAQTSPARFSIDVTLSRYGEDFAIRRPR